MSKSKNLSKEFESRACAYSDLCQRMTRDYKTFSDNKSKSQVVFEKTEVKINKKTGKKKTVVTSDVFLVPFEQCKEINLWTYWQGRGCYNPNILVIGQDWGAPCDKNQKYLEQDIKDVEDCKFNNIHLDNPPPLYANSTDDNLYKLFLSWGDKYDNIYDNSYEDLFFTNGCLGYRTGEKISGNFDRTWITRTDIESYVYPELVDILKPEIIICLGQETYLGMMEIFGLEEVYENLPYNELIEQRRVVPLKYKNALIFPVAHTGGMGSLNRGKNNTTDLSYFELQLQDWQFIKNHYFKNSQLDVNTDTKSIRALSAKVEEIINKRLLEWAGKHNVKWKQNPNDPQQNIEKLKKVIRKAIKNHTIARIIEK